MNSVSEEFGIFEGDTCKRNDCAGVIKMHPVENCSCHINPPCSACTTPRNYCPECGWEESEEPIETPNFPNNDWWQQSPKPLDNSKIDWRSSSHTHFSMIKEGVYPDGTTQEEVRKAVNGTFGGRFTSFGGGRFKFIAYTD